MRKLLVRTGALMLSAVIGFGAVTAGAMFSTSASETPTKVEYVFTGDEAGIAGFAKAAEIKFAKLDSDAQKMAELKDRLISTLKGKIENVVVNSPENSVCSVANISFPGVKSEVLLHVLESNGIYVSTGSACNSKKNKFSYVLSEMKLRADVIDSAIRFSLSAFNTQDEIDYVCKVLEREIPLLRKIMR